MPTVVSITSSNVATAISALQSNTVNQLDFNSPLTLSDLTPAFWTALSNCSSLTSITLGGGGNANVLGDAGLQALATALFANTYAKNLILSLQNGGFTDIGANAIANLTRNGPRGLINIIQLDQNPLITDASGVNLVAAAPFLSGFQPYIGFSVCGLGDATATAFANTLTQGNGLYAIDFTHNNISNLGAGNILAALPNDEAIQYVILDQNPRITNTSLITRINSLINGRNAACINVPASCPNIKKCALNINPYGLTAVNATSLSLTDVNGNVLPVPANAYFVVNASSGGYFCLTSTPGVALTKFSVAQMNAGLVSFNYTAGNTNTGQFSLPSFSLSGMYNNTFFTPGMVSGTVAFNVVPTAAPTTTITTTSQTPAPTSAPTTTAATQAVTNATQAVTNATQAVTSTTAALTQAITNATTAPVATSSTLTTLTAATTALTQALTNATTALTQAIIANTTATTQPVTSTTTAQTQALTSATTALTQTLTNATAALTQAATTLTTIAQTSTATTTAAATQALTTASTVLTQAMTNATIALTQAQTTANATSAATQALTTATTTAAQTLTTSATALTQVLTNATVAATSATSASQSITNAATAATQALTNATIALTQAATTPITTPGPTAAPSTPVASMPSSTAQPVSATAAATNATATAAATGAFNATQAATNQPTTFTPAGIMPQTNASYAPTTTLPRAVNATPPAEPAVGAGASIGVAVIAGAAGGVVVLIVVIALLLLYRHNARKNKNQLDGKPHKGKAFQELMGGRETPTEDALLAPNPLVAAAAAWQNKTGRSEDSEYVQPYHYIEGQAEHYEAFYAAAEEGRGEEHYHVPSFVPEDDYEMPVPVPGSEGFYALDTGARKETKRRLKLVQSEAPIYALGAADNEVYAQNSTAAGAPIYALGTADNDVYAQSQKKGSQVNNTVSGAPIYALGAAADNDVYAQSQKKGSHLSNTAAGAPIYALGTADNDVYAQSQKKSPQVNNTVSAAPIYALGAAGDNDVYAQSQKKGSQINNAPAAGAIYDLGSNSETYAAPAKSIITAPQKVAAPRASTIYDRGDGNDNEQHYDLGDSGLERKTVAETNFPAYAEVNTHDQESLYGMTSPIKKEKPPFVLQQEELYNNTDGLNPFDDDDTDSGHPGDGYLQCDPASTSSGSEGDSPKSSLKLAQSPIAPSTTAKANGWPHGRKAPVGPDSLFGGSRKKKGGSPMAHQPASSPQYVP